MTPGGPMIAQTTLRGRAAECAILDDHLETAQERAVVVVAEGEAGAGKSELCCYLERRAAQRGMRVVSVAGVEGESDIPLAGLSSLVRPLVETAGRLPRTHQRAVLAVAGLSDDTVTDRFTLGAATLGLLGAAAESAPIVLIVDDCHWLDGASVEALAFAARRLSADAVLIMFVTRSGQGPAALREIGSRLLVPPITPAALGEMLGDAGLAVAPHLIDAVHIATEGLPLPALETAGALSADERSGRDPLPDPLPVGRQVTGYYRDSLQALPRNGRRALGVAVAAGAAPGEVVVSALAELGLVMSDLEPAEDAGVLAFTADGDVLFTHPLMRAAAFGLLSPAERRAAHRALAAATRHDPERRARHLLGATNGPSEAVGAALEAAAQQWHRRGGPAGAAPVLAQAARATPSGEPRSARHLAAAQAFGVAGRLEEALDHAREVILGTVDPLRRADAHIVVMASSLWGPDSFGATEVAVDEARQIAAADPARAARILALACSATTSRGDVEAAHALAVEAFQLADRDSIDPAARAATRNLLTMTQVLGGRHADARRLLAGRSVAEPETVSQIDSVHFPSAVQTLVRLECLDAARDLIRDSLARCGEAPISKAYVQSCALELRWWQGRWPEAMSAGEDAVGLAADTGQEVLERFTRATLARVLATQGFEDECRRQVELALTEHHAAADGPVAIYGSAALGLLELGADNAAAAAAHLQHAEALRQSCGCQDPRTVPFGPDLIEALVRTGDRHAAHRALGDFLTMVEASDTAWAHATGARCQALLAGDDRADELFSEAIDHHARSDAPFDAARTRLCWGEHRRRRRDITGSRGLLREALERFHHLGADPWARRAAAELRAAGGRPAHQAQPELAALSPQELRCALAAAEGMSNRDAAASLFLSPRTVEYHLGKVFAKLGLTSRVQLVRLVDVTARGSRS